MPFSSEKQRNNNKKSYFYNSISRNVNFEVLRKRPRLSKTLHWPTLLQYIIVIPSFLLYLCGKYMLLSTPWGVGLLVQLGWVFSILAWSSWLLAHYTLSSSSCQKRHWLLIHCSLLIMENLSQVSAIKLPGTATLAGKQDSWLAMPKNKIKTSSIK